MSKIKKTHSLVRAFKKKIESLFPLLGNNGASKTNRWMITFIILTMTMLLILSLSWSMPLSSKIGYYNGVHHEQLPFCVFIQSHGIDTRRNFTEQRIAVAETWGKDYASVIFFVTDGWISHGFHKIALNTTSLRYEDGSLGFYKLIKYIQESDLIDSCPFIVFTDSDVYINLGNLKEALQHLSPNDGNLYSGIDSGTLKWGEFAHGSLILFSQTALKSVNVSKCETNRFRWKSKWFDVELGACIKHQGLPFVYPEHWVHIINNSDVFDKYSKSSASKISCAIVFHKIVDVSLTYKIHKSVSGKTLPKAGCPYYEISTDHNI